MRRAGLEVAVLEQALQPGGTMQTIRDGGWLVETGPTSALDTTPLFASMLDGLGVAGERLDADPAADRRYILRGGKLHALPMGLSAFLRSRLWSAAGKARLLKEPFIARGRGEETVAQFVERRLGREFLDYAINPFVAGVYAGDPETLSVRAAFPKLFALEEKYGGLVRGMIGGARDRKRRAEKAKNRARMFSFRAGMQTFPLALGKDLGSGFRSGTEVLAVRPVEPASQGGGQGGRFAVTASCAGTTMEMLADVVVLSVPSYCAAPLLRPLLPDLAGVLAGIWYPPVAEVFLGYRAGQIPRALDGFGYLIPAKEHRKILGTIWSSALFPGRAPEGYAALTSFVGGSRQPELLDLDDAALIAATGEEIRGILGARGEPVYSRVTRWARAIPQYAVGYERVTRALDEAERRIPGLFFCSNYRHGIAVGDCVMNGERIADRAASFLGVPHRRPAEAAG
jgi:oxygen-dependent protoporphyrinogen oxidase